ncbi:MAG TPA: SurA N-terminal domain-containing protein [Candidatus Methylacidiphilales bacterium]|jgi:peptidyl-prolyl cis-trans isomerase D|nr:SurA N-terminal domain-containing protein [Candidatus Methylacidiphilales bacterium]
MMKFLRSQSQTVLAVVLGFIALGFLFYGNAGNLLTVGSARTNNDFGRIDGEDVTVAQLYDAVRETRYGIIIAGRGAQLQQPGMTAQLARGAWNQLLLLHEADRLHIDATPQEIADWIRKQKVFQKKDGSFDIDNYNTQMKAWQEELRIQPDAGTDPVAATRSIFENIVRDNLRTVAVRHALFDSVRSSAQDVSAQYARIYGPTTVSYVSFDPKSSAAQLHVTPADIQAEYKNNPTNPDYRTAEKRKVDYVLFTLPPDQQKLPDDQKQAAKDALGQKALDFILAFQPNPAAEPGTPAPNVDFMAEAKKRSLNPATTDYFTADQAPAGVPPSSAFNQAAFALSSDAPVSKVVEMDNGVAVLHLAEIQPSQLRPLAEVQAGIEKELLAKNARQSAQINAQLMSQLLKDKVAKGGTFAAAAAALHQTVTTLPAFVPDSVKGDPKLGILAYHSVQLKDNEVSEPFALSEDGTYAVLHVDNRAAADPAGLAAFDKEFREEQDAQLRAIANADWVAWKDRQPGTHAPPQLDAYGGVE